jgi:hypothetical protein
MARAQVPFTVRIGGAVVAASDGAAIDAAVAAANAKARVAGLEDAFNPNVIDPAKARAFVAALLREPGDLPAKLGGRALDVEALHMRIGVSSPTTVASFGAPRVELTIDHPLSFSGRAVVKVDCDGARARAEEARRRTGAADEEVKRLSGGAQGEAMKRRFLLSHVWLDNAEAVLSCTPADAAAAADRDAAERMMRASAVPTGSME